MHSAQFCHAGPATSVRPTDGGEKRTCLMLSGTIIMISSSMFALIRSPRLYCLKVLNQHFSHSPTNHYRTFQAFIIHCILDGGKINSSHGNVLQRHESRLKALNLTGRGKRKGHWSKGRVYSLSHLQSLWLRPYQPETQSVFFFCVILTFLYFKICFFFPSRMETILFKSDPFCSNVSFA